MEFTGKTPCNNCPYRKDAPLKHWSRDEFTKLLNTEKALMGSVFGCHKNNGTVCKGWLMDQDKRNFPSISLRLELARQKITREYLDSLHYKGPLFESARDMCTANYPELSNY